MELTPLRKLVAALVQSSGRHTLHGMKLPALGKHSCARGKGSCVTCRYGFPHQHFARGGRRGMRLEKGEREGQWFARFPRNDALCCSYEAHALLANLGNIDWRPVLSLWTVAEYITKYATKAPKGSRGVREVLDAAVAEVCKYAPDNQGVDLLRRSLQKFYARTLGERDFGLFEAVHLGLRLPLVIPLIDVVTVNTLGTRRFKTQAEMSGEGLDGPATWDSKVDKFDKRRALLAADKRRVIKASEIEHVSLYEFYDKFYVSRGHLCRSSRPVCLTVIPSFGADCAVTSHARHEAYARAQVVAYWRMIPTEQRNAALFEFLAVSEAERGTVDTRAWGGTPFAWHLDRALGVQDLVLAFDGRRDRRGRETGWATALLEMLVDPYLIAFVPGWVVEQYERANPFFRGSLRKVLRKLPVNATNAQVLQRTKCLMEIRQERAAVRSLADKVAGVEQQGLDHGSESRGSSGGGEDPELDAPIDPAHVEAETAPAVAILREPLPSAGDGGAEDGGAADGDWARAGPAELLSAAGAATAAADVTVAGSSVDAVSARRTAYGASVNPPGYVWLSVVPCQDHARLRALWDEWKGQPVQSAGEAPRREALDRWQAFAVDIASSKACERIRNRYHLSVYQPLRMLCTGSAGAGKSITIRSIVCAWREKFGAAQASAGAGAGAADESTVLAAPTGCASFQMKHQK